MDPVYAEVGAEVVVGFHRQELYTTARPAYVGRKTTITRKHRYANACEVDADEGYNFWPIQDMILASDIPLLTSEQRARIK